MKQTQEQVARPTGKNIRLKYLSYVPPEAGLQPAGRLPAIFFLHGAGERGFALQRLLTYGIPRAVEESADFPFIAISPLCPPGRWWPDLLDELELLYEEAASRYPVDLERVSLTGVSMGGFGAWAWGAAHPEHFCAVAPVCGGGTATQGFPKQVQALKDTPVWAFHGALDTVVPLALSESLVRELTEAGGSVRFTIYPDFGHEAWIPTYANPELYAWFLEQRRDHPNPAG